MKQRSISVLLMFAAMLFAVVSLGGCGGSSSSTTGGGGADDSSLTMNDVWDDKEAMHEVSNRLTSEDMFNLLAVRMEGIERKADGSVTMQYFNTLRYAISDEEYPEVPYNKDELLAHYESGGIILIGSADQELVNTVLSDLGLSEEDTGTFGQSGSLEVYGLACIKTEEMRNLFVYVVPRMGDIIVSNDTSSEGFNLEPVNESTDIYLPETVSGDNAEIEPKEYTMRDFQIDRWTNFFRWMGNIAVESLNNSAFAASYQVRAADNDLASICDSQTKTFDFSYANVYTSGPEMNRTHYSCTEFKRTRNNFVSVKIFSAHSFSTGKDYYIVESTTTTVPKNFGDTVITFDGFNFVNYLYGYTKKFGSEFHIDGGGMNTNDVGLIRNMPANVNNKTTHTEGMSWSINGHVGVNKEGVSAELGGGVSYESSKTWEVSEYTIVNSSMKDYPASAKWYIDVNEPTDGGEYYKTSGGWYWYGADATAASKNQLQYDSSFIWEVGRDYWKNNPNMKMNLTFTVDDGICIAKNSAFTAQYFRAANVYTTMKSTSLKFEQPPHATVSQRTFAFTSKASNSQAFTLLAEDNWTIKDIPSWLHFTSTSGNATGSSERQILFDVDENTNTSPREAIITITSGRDSIKLEIAQSGK